jgi:hypothetical protein
MRLILFLSLFLAAFQLEAQRNRYLQEERSNEGHVLLANFLYGGHLPGGDLADRFGENSSAGGAVDFLTKSNLIVGVQSNFYFGSNVHTDVLENLRDEEGAIFGDNGGIAELRLRQRGFYIGGHIGKIFPVSSTNARSGIRLTLGGGFFRHKIRIQDDPQVFVPTLSGDYKKGYDRLTNGFALTEFIGYQYLAKNRRINFLAGFEFTQGFTEGRRSFNFDTRTGDTGQRLDLMFGFRIGWTLPFYIGENPDEIRY